MQKRKSTDRPSTPPPRVTRRTRDSRGSAHPREDRSSDPTSNSFNPRLRNERHVDYAQRRTAPNEQGSNYEPNDTAPDVILRHKMQDGAHGGDERPTASYGGTRGSIGYKYEPIRELRSGPVGYHIATMRYPTFLGNQMRVQGKMHDNQAHDGHLYYTVRHGKNRVRPHGEFNWEDMGAEADYQNEQRRQHMSPNEHAMAQAWADAHARVNRISSATTFAGATTGYKQMNGQFVPYEIQADPYGRGESDAEAQTRAFGPSGRVMSATARDYQMRMDMHMRGMQEGAESDWLRVEALRQARLGGDGGGGDGGGMA